MGRKASTAVSICALLAALCLVGCERAPITQTPATSQTPRLVTSDALARAHAEHRSNVWVEGGGTVTRILRDDTKRPRHQRFVVKVGNGPDAFTVLIAHNIDRAPRVPFKKGDEVKFRGEYVWNDQGGVVHWTHEDDRGGGGWIRWRDFVYR